MISTTTFARKHGLMETISTNTNVKLCCFTHLVVIDFEATCWNDRREAPEIIEFPAVLMETKHGKIVNEFHQYVTPIENPHLSQFCQRLTGITQMQVDDGVPLKTCLVLFKEWLHSNVKKYSIKNMAFISWSDWDFGVCLDKECKRKLICKSDDFNRWIDLRALYREHVQRPHRGLRSAVEDMGLNFEGREHSGLCDARNTAKLAWKLHCDGVTLRITKDISSKSLK